MSFKFISISFLLFCTQIVTGQFQKIIKFDTSFTDHPDTSWHIDNIKLSLKATWGPYYDLGLNTLNFGGRLTLNFEEFGDIFIRTDLVVLNACTVCTDVTFYKNGIDSIKYEFMGRDTMSVLNPWTFNPDSIVFYSAETFFDMQTIYYEKTTLTDRIDFGDNIVIYPNPTFGLFNIEFNKLQWIEYSIIDDLGHVINQNSTNSIVNSNSNLINIDLGQCPKGIYFIKIKLSNGTEIIKKILKL